ncbi:protein FAR-RED IMPAIRED RESPONSE 1-like [Carya illinoinensis]|uniref:protein FAR-RED IMPAIRED RESPONSE 1-like n=1 Tax=Carya illinoinensis TaxID=32201 RepID=UPI001C71F1D4|nr:protein FAR-RED IMPAIRED RESPONSE 1-like [Carya illinoinensis]
MAKAIVEVLPNTTHRLCLWHILQKFPEHLAYVYNKFPDFQRDFRHCIHETITIAEFEEEWASTLMKYDLGENNWLQNLYIRREKWVPAYLRSTFCAGMSTTQRSESMTNFSKTMFDLDELFDSLRYISRKLSTEGESKTYGVTPYGKETPIYHVMLESGEGVATCTCQKLEFMGIFCKHNLCVFGKKGIFGQHLSTCHNQCNCKVLYGSLRVDHASLEFVENSFIVKF